MTRTRWIIFALICLLGLAGLVVFSKKDDVNVKDTDASKIVTSDNGDHVYGNKNAKVVLYEYGDFQCPACSGAFPNLKTIKEEYKDKIAFVFRNFPLTSIHPNALAASTAAEAAALQGKYWEMHDQLYANQQSWSNASAEARTDFFIQYASNLGLDVEKFKSDMSSKTVSEKISRDRALGNKLGADSTPTFYINGEKVAKDIVTDVVQQKGDLLRKKLDEKLK
jgi:protein-disulfide isomerase